MEVAGRQARTAFNSKTMQAQLWPDATDTRQAIGPPPLRRLIQRAAASEQGHTGQLQICVDTVLLKR